jgi:hypothetical protein
MEDYEFNNIMPPPPFNFLHTFPYGFQQFIITYKNLKLGSMLVCTTSNNQLTYGQNINILKF